MNCIIEFILLEEQNKKHSDKTLYVKVRIKSEESYYDISFLLPTRWKIDESLWIKDKFYEENGIKYIIGGIKGARETGKKQINFKIGPRLNWELKNLHRSLLRDLQKLIDK